MRLPLLSLLLILTLLTACSSPDKLILGKWKFDRIETAEFSSDDSVANELGLEVNTILEEQYQYMHMEFFSNGECFISYNMFSNQSNRPYTIEDNGKYINTTNEFGQEDQIEIVRLNDKELAIDDGGMTLVLVRE